MAELFEETLVPTAELDLPSMPLQDITMSQTLTLMNSENTTSHVKTSGGTKDGSPMAGSGGRNGSSGGVCRTMKEYEDKLENLTKENFSLKLRIYFLEEGIGVSCTDQNAAKKNIELKEVFFEMESLKKELVEKQELLNQAARAFELIEEQKKATAQDQAQYQLSLEKERERVTTLERELAEYQEKEINASMYYNEAFSITPEQALENTEKLQQMEELVASLEAEVKQITGSLEEERNWAQELENERDQFRQRLDVETRLREKQDSDRIRDIEELREKVKTLEEQLFKKDNIVQQYKNDLAENDRLLREKNTLLQEKCQAYEEANLVSEKRKKQIVQLRASVKTRDDALTDLNYKHRALLSQYENGHNKRSPCSSPPILNSLASRLSPPMGQKSCVRNILESDATYVDFEFNKEKPMNSSSPLQITDENIKEIRQLTKELEERDNELKRQEETKKQLILKLCNAQKQAENFEQRVKKIESEHEKAIKAIQGFIEREQQMEDVHYRKERKILELETELRKLQNHYNLKMKRNDLVSLKELGVRNIDDTETDFYKQNH